MTASEPGTRLAINCHGCGMLRLLPTDLKVGDVFSLVTCVRCSVPSLVLQLREDGVHELSRAAFASYLEETSHAEVC